MGNFRQQKCLPTGQVTARCLWASISAMNRIRDIRQAKGLTLAELAKLVGITVPHLSRMERSERPLTDVWMQRIGSALSVEPRTLMPAVNRPFQGELIEDPDELSLVWWWRTLGPDERHLVTRMMHPPLDRVDRDKG